MSKNDIAALAEQVEKLAAQTGTAIKELQEHVVLCNGYQQSAQDWRKQITQRVIEVQENQRRTDEKSAKQIKKISKRIAKQNVKIIEASARQDRQATRALSVLVSILMAIVAWFIAETYFSRQPAAAESTIVQHSAPVSSHH